MRTILDTLQEALPESLLRQVVSEALKRGLITRSELQNARIDLEVLNDLTLGLAP